MECNSCCFGRCKYFGHLQSMVFRERKGLDCKLDLIDKSQGKIFIPCSMLLTTFQFGFLLLIVLRSLYLHVLVPLSHRLNVNYHNGWMSAVNTLLLLLSIIDCASFFVSSCFSSPEP